MNQSFRFYSLSDKIRDREVLEEAYRRQKANNGAPAMAYRDYARRKVHKEDYGRNT
jgi:hypothetical protein